MVPCLDSEVEFDDSSIKHIFNDPGEVLKDIRGFWEKEVPYRLTLQWSEATRVPIDFDGFRDSLAELDSRAPEDRRRHEAYRLAEEVMGYVPVFESRALPHVCSYLPADARVNTTVRLACFMPPWAYCAMGSVIVNTSHRHWENDAGMVLNIVIHELFHIGFGRYIEPVDFDEIDTSEKTQDLIMMSLQNEGMATYVAYRGRHIFPSSTADPDYSMLEDTGDLRRQCGRINHLFEISREEPFERIRDAIWDGGVRSRAYYVVGAHMAKRIEEERGRRALVETIPEGARHFIDSYNDLGSTDLEIVI